MEESAIIIVTVLVGVVYTVFNILTLSVFCLDKQLRRRPANYPIVSFLIGSAVQGMIPTPLYIYKVLKHRYSYEVPRWLCDTYRFPYIFCGHIMEFSIMVISFDRLIAVVFPFNYHKQVTKFRMVVVQTIGWMITVGIDIIPFFSRVRKSEECHYVPTRLWGLLVIIFYNILPFCVVVINYSLIWKVARTLAVEDKKREESMKRNCINAPIKDGCKDTTTENLISKHRSESHMHKTMSKLKFTFEMKATKTSLAIVGVYLVCWIPMGIFFMADHFCYNCISDKENLKDARRAVKILAFSSSILAPLIYCWWNQEFRNGVKRLKSRASSKDSNKPLMF